MLMTVGPLEVGAGQTAWVWAHRVPATLGGVARAWRPGEPIVPPSRPVPSGCWCVPRRPSRDHSRPCGGRRPHQCGCGGAGACTRRGGSRSPADEPTDRGPASWFRGQGGRRWVHRPASQPGGEAPWQGKDQGGQGRQGIPRPTGQWVWQPRERQARQGQPQVADRRRCCQRVTLPAAADVTTRLPLPPWRHRGGGRHGRRGTAHPPRHPVADTPRLHAKVPGRRGCNAWRPVGGSMLVLPACVPRRTEPDYPGRSGPPGGRDSWSVGP